MRWAIAAVITAAAPLWAAQPTTTSWEYKDGGRWQQVTAPTTSPAVQDEVLDRVEQMIENKQADAAHKIIVSWLRSHKTSPIRDRGLYLLGQSNFLRGERIMSFYNFDELMDAHPASRYYYAALERQYEIADAYLKGYKNRFLGMAIVPATEEATEMLYRIQQRAPGSPLAEKALLRVADYYYATSEFDLAADAYAAYVRGYPRSPYLPRVRLRQAFSALAQFRGVRFDATPIIDARQQLTDLSAAYPLIAEQENIAAIVQRIDAALAQKLLVTAEFYKRTHRLHAQAYYYRQLIRLYPNSPEARTAREKLAAMPPSALVEAQGPATRPASRPATPWGVKSR